MNTGIMALSMVRPKKFQVPFFVLCWILVAGTVSCNGDPWPQVVNSSVQKTVEAQLLAQLVAEKAQQTLTAIHQADHQAQTVPPLLKGEAIPEATATPQSAGCEWTGNQEFESQLIILINDERSARGLSALGTHAALVATARGHSQDMACHNFFSHNGSNGSSPYARMVAAGYRYSLASESLYAGNSVTADEVLKTWLGSNDPHDYMLHPDIVHLGIGYAYTAGSTYGVYVTANFGKPYEEPAMKTVFGNIRLPLVDTAFGVPLEDKCLARRLSGAIAFYENP